MEKRKRYSMKMDCYIKFLILVMSFSSCQREIPEETRSFLHGAWAQEGFTDSLRQMRYYWKVFDAMGDTMGIVHIDLCYDDRPEEKKWFSKPWNADSLTDKERYSRNSIWVLEDDYLWGLDSGRQNAFRLYYQGDNFFLSDPLPDGNRKYCKIISMKDKKVEYGLVDKNKNIKSSCCLELLFHAKQWYYERFDFGWDELESTCIEFHNFCEQNSLYGVTGVILFKRNMPTDSLIHTFSKDDVLNERGILMSSLDEDYVRIDTLIPLLKFVDLYTVDGSDPQDQGYFCATWKGDTATLENYRIEGEYYLVLKRD